MPAKLKAPQLVLALWLIVLAIAPYVQLQANEIENEYVGSAACQQCHTREFEAWQGSHHDLAMQSVSEESVLGDFNDARFLYHGVSTRFYRADERFMVDTDGADGKVQSFEVAYVFGVYPLQQYLIAFPDGRMQALGIAWDSRAKEEGGQRWFHLYPQQHVDHRHELHWTRNSQTWNHQCAACHSTNMQKNYQQAEDRYSTTWSELNVACEACHGPGSAHLQWASEAAKTTGATAAAEAKDETLGLSVVFPGVHSTQWPLNESTGSAVRQGDITSFTEIETCASCHARRGQLSEHPHPGSGLLASHRVSLLDEGLYHADGSIDDEVYVYGSFLQSKMYQQGVSCSNCHDPHSTALKLPGNAVCTQCHDAARFDSKSHHFHAPQTAGARCADCHMPAKTYMVVDPRHDHSFSIPLPLQSAEIGADSACVNCHSEQSEQWAAEVIDRKRAAGASFSPYQDYAPALQLGRTDGPGAKQKLVQLVQREDQPAIARATALSLLPPYLDQAMLPLLQQSLESDDAIVRMAAVGAVEQLPPQLRATLLSPLLKDPLLAVRVDAARILADVPSHYFDKDIFNKALAEYIGSQKLNSDRPEGLMNLSTLSLRQGDSARSKYHLQQAIKRDASFVPAYVNLADLYRGEGRDDKSRQTLQQGLSVAPDSAELHYSLGLAQVRAQKKDKALQSFAKASDLGTNNSRYAYVYAIALHGQGNIEQAIAVLEASYKRRPTHRDTVLALVQYLAEAGQGESAQRYTDYFLATWPDDQRGRQLRAHSQ